MLNLNDAFTVDRFTPWIKIQLIKIIGVSAGSFCRRIIEKTEELIFQTALHSKQNSSIRKFDTITGIQNRSLCQGIFWLNYRRSQILYRFRGGCGPINKIPCSDDSNHQYYC